MLPSSGVMLLYLSDILRFILMTYIWVFSNVTNIHAIQITSPISLLGNSGGLAQYAQQCGSGLQDFKGDTFYNVSSFFLWSLLNDS